MSFPPKKKGDGLKASDINDIYNQLVDIRSPKLLRYFHHALANVANAPVDVFILGDSVSEGAEVLDRTHRWQTLVLAELRKRYNPAGIVGGIGYTPAVQPTVGGVNWPWTSTTGLTTFGTETVYGLQRRGSSVTNGLATNATLSFVGTSVRVHYAKVGRADVVNDPNNCLFGVSIDGAIPTTISTYKYYIGQPNPGPDPVDGYYQDFGPLVPGNHTITITARSAVASLVSGITVFNGDENAGIRFWDSGKSGATTATFTAPTATWASYLPTIVPELVIIELGANDSANTLGVDVYTANLQALVSTFRAGRSVPPSIVFVNHAPRSYAGDWTKYIDAMTNVALTDGDIALMDIGARIGPATQALTNGIKPQLDTVHLTEMGARLWSNALVNFLLP